MHIPPAKAWNFDIDKYLNPFIPRYQVHRLPHAVSHFLGHRDAPRQPLGNLIIAAWALLGGFCGTAVLSALFMSDFIKNRGAPIIIGSYGAAAILEYNAIDSPFSQPRNAVFGQFVSALVGVCITKLFGLMSPADFEELRWLAGALAVGVASALMTLTKTVHPPAGATALLAAVEPALSGLGWFYLPIVLLSSVVTLAVACLINNVQRQFPQYWWTPHAAVPRVEEKPADKDLEKSSKVVDVLRESSADNKGAAEGIVVRDDGVFVPAYLYLSGEERRVLEMLQDRLRNATTEGQGGSTGTESVAGSSDRDTLKAASDDEHEVASR